MVAGLMEPCWVYAMERSEHFRRLGYVAATVLLIAVDLGLLSQAMGPIGAGIAYTVLAGIGAVVTFAMVAVGVVGIQATGKGHA